MSDCTFADTVFNFSLHLRLMERPAMIFQQQQQEEVQMEVKEQRRRLVLHCSRLGRALAPIPSLAVCFPVLLVHSQQSQPNALNNISHWFPLVFLFLLSAFSLSRCLFPYISCVLLLA